MPADAILEIGIDEQERLYVRPATRTYTMIYREAVEVNWDAKRRVLFSPKPREWTYLKWFSHIISTADPCASDLTITSETQWHNISEDLRISIVNWMSNRPSQSFH